MNTPQNNPSQVVSVRSFAVQGTVTTPSSDKEGVTVLDSLILL
jgi:hypothetical protein